MHARAIAHHLPDWRAVPFFIPGWLYLPILSYTVRVLPETTDENVLALALQLPAALAVVSVLFPIYKRWTSWTEAMKFVFLPISVIALVYVLAMPD